MGRSRPSSGHRLDAMEAVDGVLVEQPALIAPQELRGRCALRWWGGGIILRVLIVWSPGSAHPTMVVQVMARVQSGLLHAALEVTLGVY